ncbi:uncharacterized protein LOC130647801 [Hydractinia symbiolongicarpus]|uniref:uncharacterized protein LOC130647801 n=1 Tax=Hydractinia symbiolongicarpus TaxID=13093 RepID=UPI00254EE771|nr:uncharacterized protein LOC130647801 [Hydractinia symbiolongicarpus]
MRPRTVSAVERPAASKLLTDDDRRNSLCETHTNKEEFVEEKLEKYRILLEREYELKTRMLRTYAEANRRCASCCDCGKQIHASSTREHSLSNVYRHQNEERSRNRSRRPLSADNIDMKNAFALRKITADEKANRRRESIRSLEQDFVRARSLMRRSRKISSNDSLNESLNESSEQIASSSESLKDIREIEAPIRQRPISSCI